MDNENNAPNNCQLSIVNYQSLLKKYWVYEDFRGIQKEIIVAPVFLEDGLNIIDH